MLADLLTAGLQVAFNHQALYHGGNVGIMTAAVEDLLGNTDLFHILLAGVGMIAVHNAGGILQISFHVHLVQ